MACPQCGSDSVAGVLYGNPQFSPELLKAVRERRLELGGCPTGAASTRRCNACGHRWRRLDGTSGPVWDTDTATKRMRERLATDPQAAELIRGKTRAEALELLGGDPPADPGVR